MAYKSCPHCMALNRATDTQCYQCQGELGEAPPPPPIATPEGPAGEQSPWAEVPQRVISKTGETHKPRDLASRYERKAIPETNATLWHGLRCGPLAGLVLGAAMGMYRNYQTDELAKLLIKKFKIDRHGLEMMVYSVGADVIYGTILGMILGLTNLLCFPPESARTGAILGALSAAVLIWMAPNQSNYMNILVGLIHGAALAWLISTTERKLFRGL